MTQMTSWHQLSDYENQLVAYTTTSFFLGAKNSFGQGDGFSFDGTTLFGIVREWQNLGPRRNGGSPEIGHRIIRVLRPQAFPCRTLLSDYHLAEPFFIKKATSKEIDKLIDAISKGEAKLEGILSKERAIKILQSDDPFPSFVKPPTPSGAAASLRSKPG